MSEESDWCCDYEAEGREWDGPGYELAIYEWAEEEILTVTFEKRQDDEEMALNMGLLKERQEEEWPEDLSRQYDETPEQAHRRQQILSLVRHFLKQ